MKINKDKHEMTALDNKALDVIREMNEFVNEGLDVFKKSGCYIERTISPEIAALKESWMHYKILNLK